jgi:hypothetical protein
MTESIMPASIASCARAESHCLSKLSVFTAADLIDDTLNPVGRLEDGADLATVVKKAENSNAV